MLDRAHRVRSSSDFRDTMRRGRKAASPVVVIYARHPNRDGVPTRFGFVVSKAVGNAVVRNRVKRRARAIAAELLGHIPAGTAVVMRMLPAAAEVSWDTLRDQVTAATRRAVSA